MPKDDDVLKPTTLDEVLAEETSKIDNEVVDEPIDVDEGGETTADESDLPADSNAVIADETEDQDDEPAEPVLQDLPEDVAQFVDEKLKPIEVWGRDGESGKIQKFSVKSAYDLPEDFIPRSYKDQQIQSQQFAKQDRLISKLEDDYVQIQTDNARAAEQSQLEASWSVELSQAQAEGRIPKVKVEKPGDAGFDKAAEVIQYLRETNDKLAAIKAPYRVQSFTQALDLYEANQLKTTKTSETAAADDLKSKKGSMVGGGRPGQDQFSDLPKAGTKLEDILAQYAN